MVALNWSNRSIPNPQLFELENFIACSYNILNYYLFAQAQWFRRFYKHYNPTLANECTSYYW